MSLWYEQSTPGKEDLITIMSIEMNSKRLSGCLALGALALTIGGPISRSAYAASPAASQDEKTTDQKAVQQAADKDVVLVALAAPAPVTATNVAAAPVYTPPA